MKKPWLTWLGLLIVPVLCFALWSSCGSGGDPSSPTDGSANDAAGGRVGDDGGAGGSGGAGGAGGSSGGVDADVGRVDAVPFVTSCEQNPCDSEYTRCVPVYGGTGCAKACPGMPCASGLQSWCTRTGGFICVAP